MISYAVSPKKSVYMINWIQINERKVKYNINSKADIFLIWVHSTNESALTICSHLKILCNIFWSGFNVLYFVTMALHSAYIYQFAVRPPEAPVRTFISICVKQSRQEYRIQFMSEHINCHSRLSGYWEIYNIQIMIDVSVIHVYPGIGKCTLPLL